MLRWIPVARASSAILIFRSPINLERWHLIILEITPYTTVTRFYNIRPFYAIKRFFMLNDILPLTTIFNMV